MSCLAMTSSLSLSGSGAEKMKRFRESKCLKVKRRPSIKKKNKIQKLYWRDKTIFS